MIYEESLAWLYATQQFGIKLGLENIRGLLEALGDPRKDLSFLHVAVALNCVGPLVRISPQA